MDELRGCASKLSSIAIYCYVFVKKISRHEIVIKMAAAARRFADILSNGIDCIISICESQHSGCPQNRCTNLWVSL